MPVTAMYCAAPRWCTHCSTIPMMSAICTACTRTPSTRKLGIPALFSVPASTCSVNVVCSVVVIWLLSGAVALHGFVDNEILQNQRIHPASGEGTECIGRSIYDRLTLQIERSIEHDGNAGGLTELLDQRVIARTVFAEHGLQAASSVHMCDRGQGCFLFFLD